MEASRFRDSWDPIQTATEWIFTQDKGVVITGSLQPSATMFLYINQQLNVILYTYSFKRNSNQSLELNNPSPRENHFQKIKPNIRTQDLWATKNTLFSTGERTCCITIRETKDSDVPMNNQKPITGQVLLAVSIRTALKHRFSLGQRCLQILLGNRLPVRAGKSSISEKWLTDFISFK